MPELTIDATGLFEAYRSAIAPTLRVQQEGLKAIERLGRYQYAVATDYLEWSLAQSNANLTAKSPIELAQTQTELATQLKDKIKVRAQEFVNLAVDAQSAFTQLLTETTAKAAEAAKKAA
jgi:hypothetical protein